MEGVRVLLSEGSSLTAREVLTCLGPAGYHVETLDPDPLCLARFSRWTREIHRCPRPGTDPLGYLEAAKRVVVERRIDVVLPTHEQAWLFAAAGRLRAGVPLAVADAASFERVQSKIEFARLLDELGLAQPRWQLVRDHQGLERLPFRYWLKSAFSTAGGGVRLVTDERTRAIAARELLDGVSGPVMAQQPATGQYAQVQGLFDRGRLVAVHTSAQTGTGIGPSAAARVSVDHPIPRRDIAALGEALAWHGGLTLDYLHKQGEPSYIECNPRTVEPGNAAASGVNLPELQIRLTMGKRFTAPPTTGTTGVRTHGTIALILGSAAYGGTRRAVIGELGRALARRGCYQASAEQLTPGLRDPPSAAALAFVIAQALASPHTATATARKAVARYSISPTAVETVRTAMQ
jgi:biotin carboxylase